jgi:hypothetical protein
MNDEIINEGNDNAAITIGLVDDSRYDKCVEGRENY